MLGWTGMPQFTRKAIIAALATLEKYSNSDISRFLLEHALENTDADMGNSKRERTNGLIRYLLQRPDAQTEDGANLVDTIVRDLVQSAARSAQGSTPWREPQPFAEAFPELARALKRDGFEVINGELRRVLPEALNLPAADDEVHARLREFGFDISTGHLDQAIQNHAQGNWAAANAQIRTYVESLFDEIAEKLAGPSATLPAPGHQRRIFLANLNPPFLLAPLNEWEGQGKGFLEGFLRRLHPEGSHPGLSDEDDSTFRLHVVLLVSRLLLQRLRARLSGT